MEQQTYKNHARFHPPFHFIVAPIILTHLGWTAKLLLDNPGWPTFESFMLAIGLFFLAMVARTSALKAQDRVIRLEERLRYQQVLSPDLAAKASELPVNQIVALRFASDAELPGLVQKALAGQFAKSKEIKEAIQTWRPDFTRV